MIHLDTHVLVWLYQGRLEAFPPAMRAWLGAHRPMVSPAVRLELALLHEIGRLADPPHVVLERMRDVADLGVAESHFDRVAAIAARLDWTRDPFDRLIVAHAMADDLPLATRDARMLERCPLARWG